MYYEEFDWRTKLYSLNFNTLDELSKDLMERGFMEEEIYEGLMQCRKDKVPGLDDFNMVFFCRTGIW